VATDMGKPITRTVRENLPPCRPVCFDPLPCGVKLYNDKLLLFVAPNDSNLSGRRIKRRSVLKGRAGWGLKNHENLDASRRNEQLALARGLGASNTP